MDEVILHHFDGEPSKQFNMMHPQFLMGLKIIHIGLFTNGFNLFGLFAAFYSCWSVILTIYDLTSVKYEDKIYVLSMVMPIPYNPDRNINVYL